MGLDWLGKYQEFVSKLVDFGNAYAQNFRVERNYNTPVELSASEMQVIEYILQREHENYNMAEIATLVGVSQSTFSKNVNKLRQKGLLEKFHTSNNRKEIIVRVSDYGKEVYEAYRKYAYEALFKRIFEILEEIPEEYVAKFTEILDISADATYPTETPTLIKIND